MSPLRPPHACSGCGVATHAPGRCSVCRRKADRARGTSFERGYNTPEHKAWRAAVLDRDRVCVDPTGRHSGELRAATVADHIQRVRAGGAWLVENGQGLCEECHNAKRGRESHGER